jgi:hypothetical protein
MLDPYAAYNVTLHSLATPPDHPIDIRLSDTQCLR